MQIDASLFAIIKVTEQNHEQYAKLLHHFGYSDFDTIPFEVYFMLYGNEIFYNSLRIGENLSDRRGAQESTEICQQIFRDYPITNVWDITFNFRLLEYTESDDKISIDDLRQVITEKTIQNPAYLPFVSESRGIILWRHQAKHILGLFFENRHVIDYYIRELAAKRIPTRDRLNLIEMPTGEKLADFLCEHSLSNGVFHLPNLKAAW